MARPVWKGSISFGLVNIPVTVYSAEEKKEMRFKLLDRRTNSPIRYERVSEETGEPVPWDQVVKAFQLEEGGYVVLTEEDFEKAAVEATRTIEIEDFVDLGSIEYKYFEKPYYLVPAKRAEKGYVLLREVLKRTGKVAIAKVVIRSRQYLAAVIPQGCAMVLNIMRYYGELRDASAYSFPTGSIEDYKVSEKELQVAEMLVQSMSSVWEPQKYRDEYRDALMAWIEKKTLSGGVMPTALGESEEKEEGKVVDIMELLKRSVEKAASRRGQEAKTKNGERAA